MDNITEIEKLFRKHSRKSPITYNEFLEAGWTKENYFEYLRRSVVIYSGLIFFHQSYIYSGYLQKAGIDISLNQLLVWYNCKHEPVWIQKYATRICEKDRNEYKDYLNRIDNIAWERYLRMDVVKSIDEIRINMKTMDSYLVKADDPEYAYALGLISKGICFVADASTDEYRFYPSRFIGYANNTMSKHECNSSKDGRVTNPAISKVLNQKPEADSEMEIAYKEYCKSLGIQVKEKGSFGVSRKYWKFSY